MAEMSDSKVQQEPSIEEILSSIRQIINEDGEGGDTSGAPPHPSPMSGNDDDVLDLANIAKPNLNTPPPVPAPAPAPAPVAAAPEEEAGPDLDFDDKKSEEPMKADDIDAMFDAPAPAPTPAPAPVVKDEGEGIVADDVLNAAAASLTRLAQAEVMIDRKHATGMGSITLEDVVKEMLRPMMKSWLDENLPPLVERLVQKEIQKISSRL